VRRPVARVDVAAGDLEQVVELDDQAHVGDDLLAAPPASALPSLASPELTSRRSAETLGERAEPRQLRPGVPPTAKLVDGAGRLVRLRWGLSQKQLTQGPALGREHCLTCFVSAVGCKGPLTLKHPIRAQEHLVDERALQAG